MPNWVCNHLTIRGEQAKEVLKSVLKENPDNEYGYDVDFNKITPMPPELNIVSGGQTDSALSLYLTSVNPLVDDYGTDKMSPDLFVRVCQGVTAHISSIDYRMKPDDIRKTEEKMQRYYNMSREDAWAYGKHAADNYINYGAIDWYDWCCQNWGTKWNACRTQIPNSEVADVYFDTAWSPVTGLIQKLAEKYSDCSFYYEFAEEQAGILAGTCLYSEGTLISQEYYDDGSKEAYETFFSLWGLEDEYRFNKDTGTYEYIEEQEEM